MTTETGNKTGAASVTSNAAPSSLSVVASVAKHTAGRWWVDAVPGALTYRIESEGGRICAATSANAARIVACVNYCEGIGAEVLNGPKSLADFRAYAEALLESSRALRAQRDELRAVLLDVATHAALKFSGAWKCDEQTMNAIRGRIQIALGRTMA